ncbi:MAG: ribosome biogenesis GTP-binding protein YihA/YsxC [Acidimicrobiales bacterium]
MTPPLQVRFVTSAPAHDALPDTPAEIALIGRSNVGKSSLLNALAHRKDLAKTSKTPGRTQLLNCFTFDDGTAIIDCPGYGFANAPVQVRRRWQQVVEDYLRQRRQLVMAVLLVDGEVGPTKLDRETLSWLRHTGVPLTVVATKHDKVKSSQRDKRKGELAEGCGVASSDVVWVSAAKGIGIDRLRQLVRAWLSPDSEEQG